MEEKVPRGALPVACFAPPLSDELLAQYKTLIDIVPNEELRDALLSCYNCVMAWWNLPESKRNDGLWFEIKHKDEEKRLKVIPLEDEQIKQLWDATPWMRELNLLSTPQDDGLFDKIKGTNLRNAAFHLLWYAKEISLDREPITEERLK